MTGTTTPTTVTVGYRELTDWTTRVFTARGVPAAPASQAATALCYGDAAGHASHGLANLTRLYLPLIDSGRADPAAEPRIVADRGAAVLLDARRALGLWLAGEAMRTAVDRAAEYGIGMVSVRGATHIGCAGHHAAVAVPHRMIGIVASNCGRQRIARPPDGRVALMGTNPLSIAAPAGRRHPYVLDMSTTAAPTGRIREAARAGLPIPPGWLADDSGRPVTDPASFDSGDAHLLWPGGYKGYGLGLAVEVLAALLPGAGFGPEPAALEGDGAPTGRDDDIGLFVMAIAPGALRSGNDAGRDAERLFETVLACPPVRDSVPVRYPGWYETERILHARRSGVRLAASTYRELCEVADGMGIAPPEGGQCDAWV